MFAKWLAIGVKCGWISWLRPIKLLTRWPCTYWSVVPPCATVSHLWEAVPIFYLLSSMFMILITVCYHNMDYISCPLCGYKCTGVTKHRYICSGSVHWCITDFAAQFFWLLPVSLCQAGRSLLNTMQPGWPVSYENRATHVRHCGCRKREIFYYGRIRYIHIRGPCDHHLISRGRRAYICRVGSLMWRWC